MCKVLGLIPSTAGKKEEKGRKEGREERMPYGFNRLKDTNEIASCSLWLVTKENKHLHFLCSAF
jgi:hypothetical protein